VRAGGVNAKRGGGSDGGEGESAPEKEPNAREEARHACLLKLDFSYELESENGRDRLRLAIIASFSGGSKGGRLFPRQGSREKENARSFDCESATPPHCRRLASIAF
jgi:hypothetical protein